MDGRKPILCLDFDGVIHSYTSGWTYAHVVADPPVPGAMQFIVEASKKFRVNIYSSRSGQHGGITAMAKYVREHMAADQDIRPEVAETVCHEIEWPTEKPPAMVTIDDRAITFTGTWPAVGDLLAFKPWNKR